MAIRRGDVELFYGPTHHGAPDDLRQVIVDFIDGAQRSLDIAIQEVDDIPIAEAIIRAKERNVRIRIVLEQDYLKERRRLNNPFANSNRGLEPNRLIFAAFLRSNIDVRADYNSGIFHQKFIVRDRKSLLTGSTNFTTTGVESNFNHVIVIHSKANGAAYGITKKYSREFDELLAGKFGKKSDVDWNAPRYEDIGGVKVKCYFAPDNGPEKEIMKQILKATTQIHFAIFTFAASSGIDDTMIVSGNSGIKYKGIFNSQQVNQVWAANRLIHNPLVINPAIFEFYSIGNSGNLGKVHHKLMVIDDRLIIAGSFNYTGPANYINDENIVIIGDLEETSAGQRDLAISAIAEIDRIIDDFGQGQRIT